MGSTGLGSPMEVSQRSVVLPILVSLSISPVSTVRYEAIAPEFACSSASV